MGAVKTNRRTAEFALNQKPLIKEYKEFIRYFDGANNRRKMAGLPLIRRAR